MDIVKTDNLPQGQMPTIFEDRTLFPPPPVIDARYKTTRSTNWVVPTLIFAFMSVLLLGAAWFAYSSEKRASDLEARIDGMVDEQVKAETSQLNAEIVKISAERDALAGQLATLSQNRDQFDRNLGRLITESAALVKEIDELLAVAPRLRGPRIPAALTSIPADWDAPSTAVLQRHVDLLKEHRIKVINHRDPTRPSEGTISGN